MKNSLLYILFILVLIGQNGVAQSSSLKMWYDEPSDEWMKSLPIGNGRLGGMVFGGVEKERIALNEITLWSGQPDPNQDPSFGKEALRNIQQMFLEGKLEEGDALGWKNMSSHPASFGTHLPFGEIVLDFKQGDVDFGNYIRSLDLEKGMATVSYQRDGVTYHREYFCSNPANVLIVRLSASKKGKQSFEVGVNPLRESAITTEKNTVHFAGKVDYPKFGPGGVDFYGAIRVLTKGGDIKQNKESLSVEKADEVLLIVDLRTDFISKDFKEKVLSTLSNAEKKKFKELKREHQEDFVRLFNRVSLSLGASRDNITTDERLKLLKAGNSDPDLVALFFQYGRYLLISSSRENSPLPANLQGIWNDNLACNMPWTCDYHLDINTQQNYWAANICNLSECNEPLFNYIKSLAVAGKETAKKMYGCDGWVAHTVANVWGFTAPGWGSGWGLHSTGGAWLATHMWEHYCFTQDKELLADIYPVLKQSALFFLDYMIEDPESGYLLTGPSNSPENFYLWNGKRLSLSLMPTCDRIIIYEIFNACRNASELLQIDEDFRKKVITAIAKLPPLKIGKHGQIQEWQSDYEEAVPEHRHMMPLLALYPYSQISLAKTPDLAKATAVSMYRRMNAPRWEAVEFNVAMLINFFARLKETEKAYENVLNLIANFTRENMFTVSLKGIASAQEDIFIFDGNEAGPAGIAEMLLQSHEGYIELLPCLPDEWSTGSFKGLCARGGFEVDLSWDNGKVKCAEVRAGINNVLKIKIPKSSGHKVFYVNNKIFNPKKTDGFVQVDLKKGDTFKMVFLSNGQ